MKIFIALLLSASIAETPLSTVKAMSKQIGGNHRQLERTYLSKGLKAFISRISPSHLCNFDGDYLTGGQDTTNWKSQSVTQDGLTIDVIYSAAGKTVDVGYQMIKEDGQWKVDDIIYHYGIEAHLRSIMSTPVK